MKWLWMWLYKLASPRYFYQFSGQLGKIALCLSTALCAYGLLGALWWAPADYQQGDAFRIMYLHVPSAFCSLFIYSVMVFTALLSLIWRIKLADLVLQVSAPLGAWLTLLTLITGSLWGKPMWGTWWIWDARLTSELILLFLYLGVIGLAQAFTDRQARARACAILVLLGGLDLPIIHFSVYWWNSLHQGATLRLWGDSLIADSMLYPLLAMLAAFVCAYVALLCMRARTELLARSVGSQWIKEVLAC